MIFTQENEYAAVLDACVLIPMALCDCLLHLAEDTALYRPLWSEEILQEIAECLEEDFHKTPKQIAWRLERMRSAFPEAMVTVPAGLLKAAECIPDPNDRHVLAAAIMGRANAIITQNTRHFPADCLEGFGVTCLTADEFLVHQYHLAWPLVLDKLDDQAAGISQTRAVVLENLKQTAPEFCKLLQAHIR
ncbi:MAG TPA: PIN domain-containing protein [Candidatus Saccharimonadales bacterium]|jgi:predicted nucleic acid-binding protein|nr:PIN domain-containing protein [Candidatus Saccharimonadales bacterium]